MYCIQLPSAEQLGEEVEDGVEEFDEPAPEGSAVVYVVPLADVIVLRGLVGRIRFAGGGAGNDDILTLGRIGPAVESYRDRIFYHPV